MRKMSMRIALLSAAIVCSPAFAYQEAGHYYTVSVLLHAVNPKISENDARLISFCAQLPDQSDDLDAVAVYKTALTASPGAWLSWAVSSKVESEPVQRMITVQQLLHGLTGGPAKDLQSAAGQVLQSLSSKASTAGAADHAKTLCATGFAFHLYGDSFAHQVMSDYDHEEKDAVPGSAHMYATGLGHAKDMHYPDLPLCARYATLPHIIHHCAADRNYRFGRWAQGWMDAAKLMGGLSGSPESLDTNAHQLVVTAVYALAESANDYNLWNESKTESALATNAGVSPSIQNFFTHHQSTEPCAVVLQSAFDGGELPGITRFSCSDAWAEFAEVARAQFNLDPDPRDNPEYHWDKHYSENPLLQ